MVFMILNAKHNRDTQRTRDQERNSNHPDTKSHDDGPLAPIDPSFFFRKSHHPCSREKCRAYAPPRLFRDYPEIVKVGDRIVFGPHPDLPSFLNGLFPVSYFLDPL